MKPHEIHVNTWKERRMIWGWKLLSTFAMKLYLNNATHTHHPVALSHFFLMEQIVISVGVKFKPTGEMFSYGIQSTKYFNFLWWCYHFLVTLTCFDTFQYILWIWDVWEQWLNKSTKNKNKDMQQQHYNLQNDVSDKHVDKELL